MAKIETLADIDEWQKLWSGPGPLLIFKRSPICPTSFMVENIFKRFVVGLPGDPGVRICSVDVIADRLVSQRIAADTGIQHESPQALLLSGKKVLWHDSHGGVDEESLSQALKGICNF